MALVKVYSTHGKKGEGGGGSSSRGGLTSNEEGDAGGQGGPEGPFLLEEIAPLGSLDKVDGIPGGQSCHQGVDGVGVRKRIVVSGQSEQAGRRVVCRRDLTAGSYGQEKGLPCHKDQRQRPVGVFVLRCWDGHGHGDGGGDGSAHSREAAALQGCLRSLPVVSAGEVRCSCHPCARDVPTRREELQARQAGRVSSHGLSGLSGTAWYNKSYLGYVLVYVGTAPTVKVLYTHPILRADAWAISTTLTLFFY